MSSDGVVTSTLRDLSRRSGISVRQLYVLLDRGDLESSKVGGIRLIYEDSYRRLLERTRIPPKRHATDD